jgi:V/A-type H+-transporting ATPase subunit E
MQDKLHELTDKLYLEGVARGKEEAKEIIEEARSEAERITAEAHKEGEAILIKALKESEELKQNTLSELRISFRNALNSIKQDIEQLITRKVVNDPVKEVFSDTDLIIKLIEATTEKLSAGSSEAGVDIYLPEKLIKEIERYFNSKTSRALSSGIVLRPIKSMENGFEIKPHGKEYKISVTESDFASYIKEFLRPRLAGLLFEKDK